MFSLKSLSYIGQVAMKNIIDWLMGDWTGRSLATNWKKLWPLRSNSQNDELKKLFSGKLLIDTSHQMQVGVAEYVNVRIAETISQNFFEGLLDSQKSKVENIRTSRSMVVSLRCEDFKIQALSDEEQIIETNDYTQWQYKVVPLKSGTHKLLVAITILLKVEDEEARRTLPVLEKEVIVKINPTYSIKAFVLQHWQWVIASAIIPIVVMLLTKKSHG
jgi:hypothetical protein